MLKQALNCPVLKVFEGGIVVGVPPTTETFFQKVSPIPPKKAVEVKPPQLFALIWDLSEMLAVITPMAILTILRIDAVRL